MLKNSGFVACHDGEAVGGNSFQKMGVVEPYQTKSDAQGMAGVTGEDAYRFKLKGPTLRNVEMTYPYFHDGAAQTITEAVDIMGRLQLGKKHRFTQMFSVFLSASICEICGQKIPVFAVVLKPGSNPSDTFLSGTFHESHAKARRREEQQDVDQKQHICASYETRPSVYSSWP